MSGFETWKCWGCGAQGTGPFDIDAHYKTHGFRVRVADAVSRVAMKVERLSWRLRGTGDW
jgi:hypothetical protein